MGDTLSKIFDRLFDYPLKRKPPCVYRNESPVADLLEGDEDYDRVYAEFCRRLEEKRRELYGNEDDGTSRKFSEWNETTISYLQSLFLTFCDDNKVVNLKSFECILECLGDESSKDTRKNRFNISDRDEDGFINYLDFLHTIYYFHFPSTTLRRLSTKVTEKVMLINSLSLEKQMNYGLF